MHLMQQSLHNLVKIKIFWQLLAKNVKVTLLRPFVNVKARLLISRLDAARAAEYKFVRRYLMDLFKLKPQYSWSNLILLCVNLFGII